MKQRILFIWTIFSWFLLVTATVGWVMSGMHFISKNEPVTVLHLSWAAIWLTAVNNLMTVYVFREVASNGG